MKLLFFSDIHGVAQSLEKVLQWADKLSPDKLVLLGDALYHGPRNGVPGFYDPQKTASLLNANKERLVAVRGNCDTEVDQMMLDFPVLADFSQLLLPSRSFFLTHGHIWNQHHLPPLAAGSILAHGHTHIPQITMLDNGIEVFNPGSISLPKQQFEPSFGFFDGDKLSVRNLADGKVMFSE